MRTVADILKLDLPSLRRQFSVALERTVRELRGVSCVELEDAPAARQQIMCSRSFGAPVIQLQELTQAITEHTGRVAEKLRAQQSLAGQLHVSSVRAHSASKKTVRASDHDSSGASNRAYRRTAELRLGRSAQDLSTGLHICESWRDFTTSHARSRSRTLGLRQTRLRATPVG